MADVRGRSADARGAEGLHEALGGLAVVHFTVDLRRANGRERADTGDGAQDLRRGRRHERQDRTGGTDSRGSTKQGMLESSNVDPTRELIELIRTQRAFEFNSQSIKAADEALRSVAELRR